MSRIKQRKPSGTKSILAPAIPQNSDYDTPAFCFRYLDNSYGLTDCTKEEKIALLNKLNILSQLTWIQIKQQHRHKCGTETIPQVAIKRPGPSHLTPDISLLVFRFDGKKPMVGYRLGRIFHIIWLDRDFSLYKH